MDRIDAATLPGETSRSSLAGGFILARNPRGITLILLASLFSAVAISLAARLVAGGWQPKTGSSRSRTWAGIDRLGVTATQFWGISIAVGVVTYLIVVGITRLPVIALMPALVAGALPRTYFGRQRARQLARIQEAWPDGIRDIISSVRSGASVASAVEDLGRFGPEPLREAFGSFPVYARSLGFEPALEMVRSDLSDPTSDRVIEVLIVAHQRGGSVVPEILGDLATATTKDLWALEQMRSEALEQKINSRVVFALPWLVLVAITAQSGAFRDFYSSRAGVFVACLGGVMSLVGILIATRLSRQPDEPRVLGGRETVR